MHGMVLKLLTSGLWLIVKGMKTWELGRTGQRGDKEERVSIKCEMGNSVLTQRYIPRQEEQVAC